MCVKFNDFFSYKNFVTHKFKRKKVFSDSDFSYLRFKNQKESQYETQEP